MNTSFLQRHQGLRDVLGLIVFVVCVAAGTLFINTFIFRTFSVVGPSMETTMYTGDRLIVNRLPVTGAQLQNKEYVPNRGQIIVFKNPNYTIGSPDEYIVKRVIGFPGERVVVKDGKITVYNAGHPAGFNPDDANHGEPGQPTSGDVDETVPDGTLFVSGDHRQGNFSLDSRSGLGTIPYYDVVGPVSLRIWPLDKIRTF
ncbi:signal peptidase I [Candidatus Mycosynbacter amalyticus]|uniref:Signal peptidase I n=1 Tax=Candidatus Mycosynbacter amalyticus TaxID=2665156 RepID=A0A857MMK4_9BACT|nr:signal peptidase I [Candidatus Mycosynbacter amalyticus]QHN42509.1 signal peptidase I [Candidatus Mycosynbacter amalyticus]